MTSSNRLAEVGDILKSYISRIGGYYSDIEYLSLEPLFDEFIWKDDGGFYSYVSGLKPDGNPIPYDEAEAISKDVHKLDFYDFEEIDTQQKEYVIEYLTMILEADYTLENPYDVTKAFFVYMASFWAHYLSDACSADLLDDEVVQGLIALGGLVAKIEICTNFTHKDSLGHVGGVLSSLNRKKGHKERIDVYKRAIEEAVSRWQAGNNINRSKMARNLSNKFNHLSWGTICEKYGFTEGTYQKADKELKDKMVKEFDKMKITSEKLRQKLLYVERKWRKQK